jgi:hypothetical protein
VGWKLIAQDTEMTMAAYGLVRMAGMPATGAVEGGVAKASRWGSLDRVG